MEREVEVSGYQGLLLSLTVSEHSHSPFSPKELHIDVRPVTWQKGNGVDTVASCGDPLPALFVLLCSWLSGYTSGIIC